LAHKRNFERTKNEREVDRIQVDRFFKAFESSGYRETMPVVAFVKAIVQTADTAGMHGRYAKRRDEVKKLQKLCKNHLTNGQEAL
jgi:hypothetical protein